MPSNEHVRLLLCVNENLDKNEIKINQLRYLYSGLFHKDSRRFTRVNEGLPYGASGSGYNSRLKQRRIQQVPPEQKEKQTTPPRVHAQLFSNRVWDLSRPTQVLWDPRFIVLIREE